MGVPYNLYGEGFKITSDTTPDVTKQPDVIKAAEDAGKILGKRLREGYDRVAVTQKMQQKMMEMFGSSA